MSSNTKKRPPAAAWTLAIVGALAVTAVGTTALALSSAGADQPAEEPTVVEVSEDASRFVFDETPVFDDGLPDYGNSFVTQGYIYEEGTLADGGGVNADGSPTHPEAVIGTWTCEGFFIGDGAKTETGAWVITTQVFDFGDPDGEDTVVTHGIELSDLDVDVNRAVVGGTGEHAGASGVQTQTLQGFNAVEGVNLTVAFEPAE